MIPLLFLVELFHLIHWTGAAFNLNTQVSWYGYVQQNIDRTWCYYPVAGATRDVTCGGDYTHTLEVHLNQTMSIGYYQPDGSRSGGPEWPVPATNPGLIFACLSGRAQDGTYQTACAKVTRDNDAGDVGCRVAVAQSVVTDDCYEPGRLPYATVTRSAAGQARTAVPSGSTSTVRRLRGSHTVMTFAVLVVILLI